MHGHTLRNLEQEVEDRKEFMAHMKQRLAKKPWIADHSAYTLCPCVRFIRAIPRVVPSFPVACRRLTPGPGYLEALCEDNVRVSGTADDGRC